MNMQIPTTQLFEPIQLHSHDWAIKFPAQIADSITKKNSNTTNELCSSILLYHEWYHLNWTDSVIPIPIADTIGLPERSYWNFGDNSVRDWLIVSYQLTPVFWCVCCLRYKKKSNSSLKINNLKCCINVW